mmetsp:Transcript_58866/g.137065  ORF Transcript_58866/g.137065 Transcript_58866/m.137065 type:complete len:317 (+) Transcript_58866:60-1010(+)
MGSAIRTLWGDSPAVTRLVCAGCPALSLAVFVAAPLVPSAKATFLCCWHTVFQRRWVWALFLSIFYRPIQHLLSIFMILVEVYLSLTYLPERERDLGSCRFLGWALVATGAVNTVFLTAMLLLGVAVGTNYEFLCIQGLWPLLVVCITLRAMANPREPVSVCGLTYVPNRWYPVVLAVVLSALSRRVLWDVAAALVVGYVHASLQLESLLPSPTCAASLERRCLCGMLRSTMSRLGSWVVNGARGYEDLEGASHRYATLSEMRSVSAQVVGSSGGDLPLFRGPAMVRSSTTPIIVPAADAAGGPAGRGGRQRQDSC